MLLHNELDVVLAGLLRKGSRTIEFSSASERIDASIARHQLAAGQSE